MIMIIAISGTPGVGKTSVAKGLKRIISANFISLHSILVRKKINYGYDAERKTRIVSIKDLKKAIKKLIKKDKINIIEGHLAHLLDADLIIILRCMPDVLEKRMKKKRWSKNKITENLHSEILDSITIEALENNKRNKVLEIDTTGKTASETAKIIKKILNNYSHQKKYAAGMIDWSERFANYLIKK